MNINTDYKPEINIQPKTAETEVVGENKPIAAENGQIKGEVVDLRQDEITIKLADNSAVSGKILNPENIKIGMEGTFRTAKQAPLSFELISQTKQDMKNNMLLDTLTQMGFKPSTENIDKINLLMNNSFAVTKENFSKLSRALSLTSDQKQAVFFMNNDGIRLSTHNADILKGIINKTDSLSKTAEDIISKTLEISDSAVFEDAVNIISGDKREFISDIIKQLADFTKNNAQPNEKAGQTVIQNQSEQLSQEVIQNQPEQPNQKAIQNQPEQPKQKSVQNQSEQPNQKSDPNQLRENGYEKPVQQNNEAVEGNMKPNTANQKIHKGNVILKLIKENIPEKSFEQITELIEKSGFDIKKSAQTALRKKLFVNEAKGEDIAGISKSIENKAEQLSQIFSDFKEISEKINDVKQFTSQLKDVVFMQIPIALNDLNTNAELYIFDAHKKSKKGKTDTLSALLALDTAALGHFEAYITKKESNIFCQFRIENDYIKNVVETNISLLNDYLSGKNLKLSKYDFLLTDEPFTIADKDPSAENKSYNDFAFDMRT